MYDGLLFDLCALGSLGSIFMYNIFCHFKKLPRLPSPC